MQNRNIVVSQLTSYLRGLARRRNDKSVSADDAQKYLNRKGFILSNNERLSVIRSTLNEKNFNRSVLEVQSERPAAKGRYIALWQA